MTANPRRPFRRLREPAVCRVADLEAIFLPVPPRSSAHAAVVIEGVLTYLHAEEADRLLRAVRAAFAAPTLVCDLTTREFVRRYGGRVGERLHRLGAPYDRLGREALGLEAAGFRLRSRESIVGRAASLGGLRVPRWLLAPALRSLRDGYTVATFQSVGSVVPKCAPSAG